MAVTLRVASRRLRAEQVAAIFRFGLLATLYATVATLVLVLFLAKWTFWGDHPGRGLEALLEHRGEKPFVFRVLTPAVIRNVSHVVEARVAPDERDAWLDTPLRRFSKPGERWDLRKSVEFHVAYLWLFASLVVAQLAARSLGATLERAPPWLVDFAPPLAVLLLPLTFHRGGYLYDFPELAFLFLCVNAIARRKLVAVYVLFALACLNKESNALLVLYFVAYAAGNAPRRSWLRHAAVLTVLGGAIVVALRLVFADAVGNAAWFLLPVNALYLLPVKTYFAVHFPYGPLVPFPRPFHLLSIFAVGFVLAWRWSEKPIELRRSLWLMGAVVVPVYAIYGFVDEVRALSIAFPALYLAGVHTLRELYDDEKTGH